MQRKLYFFAAVFSLNLLLSQAFAWSSFRSQVGYQNPIPYQSSNPTVELRTTRSINQQQSEECYLFAFMGAVEVANLNAWKRPLNPEISAEYLFVQKLVAWSREVLENNSNISDSFYFLDGGDIHHAMKLSVEVGLLPQSLFKPRVHFALWDFPRLYSDIKELAKEGRKELSKITDQEARKKIIQFSMRKIQSRIELEAGNQIFDFNWNGKNWNVHQFENTFGIKRNSHIYMMYPQGAWDMGDPWDLRRALVELVRTFNGAFNYKQSNWSQIWRFVTQSVDVGLPAMLSMKWAGSYHVLNVVGYEYNKKGEIVSFKLKNSWGPSYGDKGHAFFGQFDLEKHVTSVWGFQMAPQPTEN